MNRGRRARSTSLDNRVPAETSRLHRRNSGTIHDKDAQAVGPEEPFRATNNGGELALPELTVDMDGVVCRPVSWFNFVISRNITHAPDPSLSGRKRPRYHHWAENWFGQRVRYAWRPAMPGVGEALADLATARRLVLLSGRPETARFATEEWLQRRGLREYFSEVLLNDRGLPNAAFKLAVARERGVAEHVDDDGRVAYFLTKDAPRTVYLVAWRGNAGLPYPPGVQRVNSLVEVAARILGRPDVERTNDRTASDS